MKNKLLMLIPCILIICMAMTNVVKAEEAVLRVDPAELTIPEEDIGKTFEMEITITDVTNLWFWSFKVTWNSTVLTCLEVTEGPFMKDVGGTIFPPPLIDNEIGEIPDMCCGLMIEEGATGTGTLATITFNATAPGVSTVAFADTRLIDWADGAEIPILHSAEPGTVTVIPEFPASMILLLFLVTTAIIAIMAKVAWSRRRREYVSVS